MHHRSSSISLSPRDYKETGVDSGVISQSFDGCQSGDSSQFKLMTKQRDN